MCSGYARTDYKGPFFISLACYAGTNALRSASARMYGSSRPELAVMTVKSLSEFVETLGENQLLDEDQLQEVTASLTARFRDPTQLAGELQRRGWLTEYQVAQVLAGK